MYDILFLSRIIPEEMNADVRSKMSRTMDDAAIVWQHHIINGIEENINTPIKLLNYLPIRSYPHYYKDAFVKKSNFSHVEGSDDVNLSFCNIKYIKRFMQGSSLYKEVEKWAKKKSYARKIIIAYTLYPEYLKAIEIAKEISYDIISAAIVLDLPEYSVLTNRVNLYGKMYLEWSKTQAQKRIKYIDNFVLLTEQMAKALSIDKPYCIIEGICSENFPKRTFQNDQIKRVFYAGTLHERFGILHLLNAFRLIKDENYRLIICGYGDSEDAIRTAAKEDLRIDFKGQLSREKVLEIMMQANVIINPRGNHEEFTKYSFPSKDIEALSSGIPFIGYKLDGIPDEYISYLNSPQGDTIEELANKIIEICDEPTEKYVNLAREARCWVSEYKNPKVQAKKFLQLIEGKE